MSFLVRCQIARLSESLLTAWVAASIRFLACVSSQMCAQIEVQRESLVADLTLVRLFPSVHELVSLQLRVVQKLFLAEFNWTNEHSFTMMELVFAQ